MMYRPFVGAFVGNFVGALVGDLVGALVGAFVGAAVGGVRNEERASVSIVFHIVDENMSWSMRRQ